MAELLPCPFCGGEAINYHTEQINFHECKHRFRCNKCDSLFYFFAKSNGKNKKQLENQAVKIWNTCTYLDRPKTTQGCEKR